MMELSELTKAFCTIFECEKSDIVSSIKSALFSDKKDEKLKQYKETVSGNLDTDELQKIFQYYYADRNEKCQDFVPVLLISLGLLLLMVGMC